MREPPIDGVAILDAVRRVVHERRPGAADSWRGVRAVDVDTRDGSVVVAAEGGAARELAEALRDAMGAASGRIRLEVVALDDGEPA